MTNPALTLVLGGASSGKSGVAEELAGRFDDVTYVATAVVDGSDRSWAERVERHRSRRPRHWVTVEIGRRGDLTGPLDDIAGAVLVDSLGTWVAGHGDCDVDVDALVGALSRRRAPTIVVSDEVGLGVHPSSRAGGAFRDSLGELNRHVADFAATVLLVVAGRVLSLPAGPPPAGP